MGKIAAFYAVPHPPIIIPEVGKGEDKKIQGTKNAFYKVAEEIANIRPDTIIVITPHGPMFRDAISLSFTKSIQGNLSKFAAPEVKFNVELDLNLTKEIVKLAAKEGIITVLMDKDSSKSYNIKYELDHGTMVPLYFINQKYTKYNLVHITYGMLSKIQLYKFGMCIKKAVKNTNINAVFLASGDLSHMLKEDGPYGYSPYGPIFDKEIISLLKDGDVLGIFNMNKTTIEKAGECALRSYYIMLGAMNGYEIKGNLLSYEDTFGVGYGVMSFSLKETDIDTFSLLENERRNRLKSKSKNRDPYVRLARESLTYYLEYGEYIDVPEYVTDEMINEKRGVFVSIKKEGQLRGCIGTILPTTRNTAMEIIRNAVEAGLHDPRFLPVTEDELDDLDFSVDVLTLPVEANKNELDPKKYGVIVRSRGKAGLLLPDLEGIDTVEEQLDIALKKGGISKKEDYTIEKFEVIRHTEL